MCFLSSDRKKNEFGVTGHFRSTWRVGEVTPDGRGRLINKNDVFEFKIFLFKNIVTTVTPHFQLEENAYKYPKDDLF